jgi:Tfp pilus assembly protein PilO
MIRLPKNFFTNLTPAQYREQLKLLPNLDDEKTQLYTMLGFTLFAMSFFGIFAINPTLSTIAELKRQFADLDFVHQQLITKNQNLSTLGQKYRNLDNDLVMVLDAVPRQSEAPKFLAQINRLVANSNLTLRSLRTFAFEITPDRKISGKNPFSFTFTLEAEGAYEDILGFSQNIDGINRLVTIESVSIDKDEKRGVLILSIRGRQYFMP